MKKALTLLVFIVFAINNISAQEPIDVAEIAIKIGAKGEEELYYGFAEGDQIVFSFKEADEREVKEVEIIELPSNSKFQDIETKEIKNKIIKVNKKGIYKFRFYNSALLKGRICKVKIQRIPKTLDLADFNTGIKWVEKFDTTYDIKTETVITGYNIVDKQKSKKIIASIDTNAISVADRLERVNSTTNLTGNNIAWVSFQLPENTASPNFYNPYRTTEVESWAYSLSVGNSGQAWYKNANSKSAAKTATSMATKAGMISTGYGALALLAIEGYSAFSNPPDGDNVKFQLVTSINNQNTTLQYGNSVAATGRVTDYKQGGYALRLENDNLMDGINVDVKVLAIVITKTYKDEYYTVQESEPIKEKKTFKIPKVAVRKIPVFADSQ